MSAEPREFSRRLNVYLFSALGIILCNETSIGIKHSMKKFTLLLAAFCSLTSFTMRADETVSFPQEEPENLIVYNRILAKVNGKTISVIDVMKKMDMFLQKHYPHLAHSKVARFQFYSGQWRDYLSQMVDQELMIADAERLEVKVTDAEVREEILNRFGPNTMPVLDKMGLSYEEAKAMIHDEMIVQRMMWFRVNSKALNSINSLDVKEAYRQYCVNNPELEEWQYQVLSIRSPQKELSEKLANQAFELLQNQLDLVAASEQLTPPDETITVTLSPEMQVDEKNVSETHKQVLKTLSENTFSAPIAQVSRIDNSVVYRIFYLKKHSRKVIPPFEKMAEDLKERLLQEAANKENAQYISKLRERLGYDEKHMLESLPNDFQPFAIR
jgi:hypothetical protein